MATLKKQDILHEVLAEYGYSGWYVIESSKLDRLRYLVFNPKEKKIGEISIPDEWFDDPRQRSTIGESLARTIQNCRYVLPEATLTSSPSGTEHQSNAFEDENPSSENRSLSAGPTNGSERRD